MKKIVVSSVLLFISYFLNEGFAQQSSSLDATHIADTYSNSIVKILLYDSIAEKNQPGSGYIGRGSGFIVTEDGLIFTNRHVVEYCVFGYMDYIYNDATTYEELRVVSVYSSDKINDRTTKKVIRAGHTAPIIQIYSGKGEDDYKLYYAKVIAMDAGAFDGAILKIVSEANGTPITEKFHPVPIGNSDFTKQGEDLCLYGFPAQFDAGLPLTLQDMSTLTFGKHSGFDFVFNKDYGYIKTDASINTGNSGGPVFNKENKVIGIATATGNKTNIGLIGGINGMYTIAKSDANLLSALKKVGLNPPPSKAEAGSAIVTGAKRPIMQQKKLKRITAGKLNERKFQNGLFYINILFSPSPINDFYVDESGLPGIMNPGIVSTSSSEGGLELGYIFPVWRAASHFQTSIDYTFFGASAYEVVFDKIQLPDTIDLISSYFPLSTNVYFFMKLGPVFSGLLFKRVTLDAYYKAVPTFCLLHTDKNALEYTIETPNGNKDASLKFGTDIMFCHAFGATIRYKILSLGVEYNFGSRNIETFYYSPGVSNPQIGFASLNRQTLFFKLGVGFGGKVE